MDSFIDIDAAIPILIEDGSTWHYVPTDIEEPPWQRFLVKVVDGHRVCHLHLMPKDSGHWDEYLIFRDALREDPVKREAYANLKKVLAAKFQFDRESYTEGKTLFVKQITALD